MYRWLTTDEVAAEKGITRQAVILAIKSGRLRAKKKGRSWMIFSGDLYTYWENKYSRTLSRHNGKLIFDKSKNLMSVDEASVFLGICKQKVYYAIRTGRLKGGRTGPNYVIRKKDLERYKAKSGIVERSTSLAS